MSQPQFERLRFWRRYRLHYAEKAFYIGCLYFSPFPVHGNHFNWGTNCTPVEIKLFIPHSQLFNILFGIYAIRQRLNDIHDGKIPLFLLLIPYGTNFLVLKKFDVAHILCTLNVNILPPEQSVLYDLYGL